MDLERIIESSLVNKERESNLTSEVSEEIFDKIGAKTRKKRTLYGKFLIKLNGKSKFVVDAAAAAVAGLIIMMIPVAVTHYKGYQRKTPTPASTNNTQAQVINVIPKVQEDIYCNLNINSSPNNLTNDNLVVESGDWIFLTTKYGQSNLYRIRKDGTAANKICDGCILDLNVADDYIYFLNNRDLCKVKTDGSGYAKVGGQRMNHFTIKGGYIYFTGGDADGGMVRMKLDGSEKKKLCSDEIFDFNMQGDWIYYSNISDGNKIYKVKTDGSNRTKITDDQSAYINLSNDWIYYSNTSDDKKMYRIKNDGSSKEKVLDSQVGFMNIAGDSIVYQDMSKHELIKADIDGKNQKELTKIEYVDINVVDNHIFCYSQGMRNIFVINPDDKGVDLNKVCSQIK